MRHLPRTRSRIAEHLAEGGVFTEERAERVTTTLAYHSLAVDLASVRNQVLTAQVAAFFGIMLYITFRL